MIATFFHNPLVQHALMGALGGWGTAALTDYTAFKAWKTWHDVLTYDWGIASFRWVQGAIGGAILAILATLGLNIT